MIRNCKFSFSARLFSQCYYDNNTHYATLWMTNLKHFLFSINALVLHDLIIYIENNCVMYFFYQNLVEKKSPKTEPAAKVLIKYTTLTNLYYKTFIPQLVRFGVLVFVVYLNTVIASDQQTSILPHVMYMGQCLSK